MSTNEIEMKVTGCIKMLELIIKILKDFDGLARSEHGLNLHFSGKEAPYANLNNELLEIKNDMGTFTEGTLKKIEIDAVAALNLTDAFGADFNRLYDILARICNDLYSLFNKDNKKSNRLKEALNYLQSVDFDPINKIIFSAQKKLFSCKSSYYSKQLIGIEKSKEILQTLVQNITEVRASIYKDSLATSFDEKNKQIAKLKAIWYVLFFGVIVFLVLLGILELIQQFKLVESFGSSWQINWRNLFVSQGTNVPPVSWNELINKLSLVLPLIWLIWFSAKRLNLLSKLEIDYQFKLITAKTFESYKAEIEMFKDKELKTQLLSVVIRNFGDNPVRLFDPKAKGHTTEEILALAKKLKDITK